MRLVVLGGPLAVLMLLPYLTVWLIKPSLGQQCPLLRYFEVWKRRMAKHEAQKMNTKKIHYPGERNVPFLPDAPLSQKTHKHAHATHTSRELITEAAGLLLTLAVLLVRWAVLPLAATAVPRRLYRGKR